MVLAPQTALKKEESRTRHAVKHVGAGASSDHFCRYCRSVIRDIREEFGRRVRQQKKCWRVLGAQV